MSLESLVDAQDEGDEANGFPECTDLGTVHEEHCGKPDNAEASVLQT